MVASGDDTISVPAMPAGDVIDTTGAGDLFAAGYLFANAAAGQQLNQLNMPACALVKLSAIMAPDHRLI